MTFKTTLTGDKALDRRLKKMEPKLAKSLQRKAVRKAAKPVLETAKDEVPKDTRDLERSLKIRALKRSRRNRGVVGVRVVTGDQFFTGDTFYGGFLEYGTQDIIPFGFMRAANDQNRDTVRNIFKSELRTLVNQL